MIYYAYCTILEVLYNYLWLYYDYDYTMIILWLHYLSAV